VNQIPLSFESTVSFAESDFTVTDSNRETVDFVLNPDQWGTYGCILCGAKGSGKTHLATIWKQRFNARDLAPDTLEESLSLQVWAPYVVLDEAVRALTNEQALFHLLNRVKEESGKCLLVFEESIKEQARLPDLRSRLLALPSKVLPQAEDELLHAVLLKQLADRQIRVDPTVVTYLVSHCERSLANVRKVVAALDQSSLIHKRPITIAMAKQVLINAN
jgi:chromosomal replication initiation ATPase DnaA